jgi:[protein-PII] uridylyltransferase
VRRTGVPTNVVSPESATDAPPADTASESASLAASLADESRAVAEFRSALDRARDSLKARFLDNEPIEKLVSEHASIIDGIITTCWRHFARQHRNEMDLVAVGGYGRGELHPQSDIDLLVLVSVKKSPGADAAVSRFFTFLWDNGLEVGHSVRPLEDCELQARKDVTVLTTLMETRLLDGEGGLFEELPARIGKERMWTSAEFFRAKIAEQTDRHHRYHDTAYNLEPNVKGSPGGLRDIQTIAWIARRHFDTDKLEELVSHQMLTAGQLRLLQSGRALLWRIRFALHLLTGRREDRLLFDYQVKLATMLGYEDATYTLAVEQLMQRYYRTVMEISRINEMLLQLFEEVILLDQSGRPEPLSANFQSRNGYLEAVDDDVFLREPSALLEIFLLLEKHLDLKGVNARTIALIKQHLWLIDEEFRQNPRHHRLFLEILRAPNGVTRTLRRMNTYGVLGLYIPAFGRVVGRMQYDLFHAYTVDAHTLFVVENLRRFTLERFNHEFPLCSEIMQQLPKPEIAYLAGLFHDIAKGRGGDHSELGAVDAEAFCLEHGMSGYDARLVAWLVKHHLLLSITAQKKDINDPRVIREFAETVGDAAHLDYLYVLTVADVRGTNPKIWNSWKNSLFRDLYLATKSALRREAPMAIDQDELIALTKRETADLLDDASLGIEQSEPVWATFTDEYFLRHRPEEIAWHTRVLIDHADEGPVLVDINDSISASLTLIMIYAPRAIHSFARSTAALDELGLNIVDARIIPIGNEQSLDTYCVLDNDGSPLRDPQRISGVRKRILRALNVSDSKSIKVTRRAPRQVRVFSPTVEIAFSQDEQNGRTVLELTAGDRPGLLYSIGTVFETEHVALQNAKIATIGERVEDVFYVTTDDGKPLDDASCGRLEKALREALADSAD